MKLSTIPRLYRNVRRWREIILVLRKYGLADWLSRLQLDFIRDWIKDEAGVPLASYTRETRIRMALTDLGPTFIKLGQVLSLRPDLVGSILATELQQLQTQVPADSFEKVQRIVQAELGCTLSDAFAEFDETPVASASIGQVHRAVLKDGTRVVVKVQHDNIQSKVREDMEVMAGLAGLAERIPELAAWQPKALIDQLSRSLQRELSFSRELNNLVVFEKEFGKFEGLRIPKPFPKLSSSRVLTMERLEGVDLNSYRRSPDSNGELCGSLPRRLAELYMEMIFVKGVYHADPHPGNVLVMPGNVIGLIDFGMVGRIDDSLRETIEEMLLAVSSADATLMTILIKRVGRPPFKLDDAALSIDVADLIATYGSQPLDAFDLTGVLNDVTDILHRHHISLPQQTSMLIKTLVTVEGTIGELGPNFSLLEIMEPYFRKMWKRRLSPKRQIRRMRRVYIELEGLVEKLPSQISSLVELVRQGKLDVHLSHRGLSPSINRLVLGMLTSSLLLGSSVLLAFKVPPLLFANESFWGMKDVSLLGLIGFVVSVLGSLRIQLAINKSGHLDPAGERQDDR
jgi:ubiquinone biosynthesis protein